MLKKLLLLALMLLALCQTSFADICPYWIEELPNGSYVLWTKVSIPANGSITLYVSKEPGYSPNGDEVFEFFDDFEGTDLDTTKWDPQCGYSVQNSTLIMYGGSTSPYYVYMNYNYTLPMIIDFKIKAEKNYDLAVGFRFAPTSGYTGYQTDWNNNYQAVLINGSYIDWNVTQDELITSFRVITWKRTDTTSEFYYDGVLKGTYTTSSETQHYYFCTNQITGNNLIVDWIRVRKYADLEPTVTVEQINSDVWKITITNPNNYSLTNFQVSINNLSIISKNESFCVSNILYNFTIPSASISTTEMPIKTELTLTVNNADNYTVNWGDGTESTTVYPVITHTYTTPGTYNISVIMFKEGYNLTKLFQVNVFDAIEGNLTILPLYSNSTIDDGTDITILTKYTQIRFNYTENNNKTSIYAPYGSQIYISTDYGYYTTIPMDYEMKAYVGDVNTQYATLNLKSNDNLIIKLNDKIIAYGNPAIATVPLGSTISVYDKNGIWLKDIVITEAYSGYILQNINNAISMFVETHNNHPVLSIQAPSGTYVLKYGGVMKQITLEGNTYTETFEDITNTTTFILYSETGKELAKVVWNPTILPEKLDWNDLSPYLAFLSILFAYPVFALLTSPKKSDFELFGIFVGMIIVVLPIDIPFLKELGAAIMGISFLIWIISKVG